MCVCVCKCVCVCVPYKYIQLSATLVRNEGRGKVQQQSCGPATLGKKTTKKINRLDTCCSAAHLLIRSVISTGQQRAVVEGDWPTFVPVLPFVMRLDVVPELN